MLGEYTDNNQYDDCYMCLAFLFVITVNLKANIFVVQTFVLLVFYKLITQTFSIYKRFVNKEVINVLQYHTHYTKLHIQLNIISIYTPWEQNITLNANRVNGAKFILFSVVVIIILKYT